MKIVLATKNRGKIKEFKELLLDHEVIGFEDILGDIEIVEDGDSFKENAIIKAEFIYEKLGNEVIVISDDSGITVPALNNEPGIYSARYASLNATDKENLDKLINELKKQNLHKAKAYYTACIAIAFKGEVYTVHGWMHGDVIDHTIGEGGFGYDPMFIPNGYDKTLGELDKEIKKKISHRSKAMNLALKVIEVFS